MLGFNCIRLSDCTVDVGVHCIHFNLRLLQPSGYFVKASIGSVNSARCVFVVRLPLALAVSMWGPVIEA